MSVASLISIQNQLNYYGYLTVLVTGIIGNLLILPIFGRQRQNACSIYLLALALTNLLYLIVTYFFKFFSIHYNDGSTGAIIFCKIANYAPSYFGQVSKTILVWACIDRYLITSHRAKFRALTTPKRAKYFIFFTYLFWIGVSCPPVIVYTVINGQCIRTGTAIVITLYSLVSVGLVPSLTLSIFTYLTYLNIKRLRSRIQPFTQGTAPKNQIIQRRDRDLLILVISEVIVYIITTAPFPAILLEMLITQYTTPMKSLYQTFVELFVFNLSFFLLYILNAAPFYIYMISSASFRRDFCQLMFETYRKVRRQPVGHPASQTQQSTMQQIPRL